MQAMARSPLLSCLSSTIDEQRSGRHWRSRCMQDPARVRPFSLLVAGYGSGNVDLANGVSSQSLAEPRVGFAYSIDNQSVVRGGFALSGWIGRFGFTGGTLSTQFPVIYNVQVGNTGGYGISGSIDSLPPVPFTTI